MSKTKAKTSISETGESVQIVPDANVTVIDPGVKKLNAEENKLIDDAKQQGMSYEISTEFIKENINIVMEVAKHLHIIREFKLYRLHYNSFEEYVEEEFNYTRGRAYQLTRAYDIAKHINYEMGSDVLTTEPQCRELLRLRIYKDDELGVEDKNQSDEARLALVKEILEENKTAKTSAIVAAVNKKLETVQAKRTEARSVDKFTKEIIKTVTGVKTRIKNLLKSKEWSKDEINKMQDVVRQELTNIFESIKQHEEDDDGCQ